MVKTFIRFIVALVISPVIWVVGTPLWLVSEYIDGNGYEVTKEILRDHLDCLTFKS